MYHGRSDRLTGQVRPVRAVPTEQFVRSFLRPSRPAKPLAGVPRTGPTAIVEPDGQTMGKLYFHYSTMNAGKSTALLQANHN